MSTITRGDLQKMKIESSVRKNDEKIKYYVNYIKEKIITNNENGDIKYCYNFNVISNKESDDIIKEIIARLQNIFVDMEIKFYKANGVSDNHISFDWSK
jgi:phenylalanyl-tRNA synthetase alpha subunit